MFMEKKEIRSLLVDMNTIAEKYDFMYRKTGGYFNIFDITNIEADEVRICRLLKELLDPKGCHCQGHVYLKLFVMYVLHMDKEFSEEDYQKAWVDREYVIDNNRRIDLIIGIAQKVIPIEVKIYASDQENQCKDYLEKAVDANMFYLTLYGGPPSEYSITRALIEKIIPISFEREILTWLDQCLKVTETKRLMPISEVLRQFIEIIRRLTNQMEEGKEAEIIGLISESGKNIKTAMMIDQSLQQAKIAMIRKLLKALDHKILDLLGIKERSKNYDLDYEKKADSYYVKKESSYPGLSYCLKKDIKKDVDVCFRVEIEDNLFCGYCTPEKYKCARRKLSVDEAKKILKSEIPFNYVEDSWWIYWEHLPNKNETPNFKVFNDAWYNLFDEMKFNQFIENCIKTIKKVLAMQK